MKASLRRIAALAAISLPLACAARELDADALDRATRGLASNAQEARAFVEALRDDQLSYAYAYVHREALAKQVRDAGKPLDDPAPAPLAERAAHVKGLAARLGAALERLNGHIGELEVEAVAAREFEAVRRELAQIPRKP